MSSWRAYARMHRLREWQTANTWTHYAITIGANFLNFELGTAVVLQCVLGSKLVPVANTSGK